jgi:hypothetical protein
VGSSSPAADLPAPAARDIASVAKVTLTLRQADRPP